MKIYGRTQTLDRSPISDCLGVLKSLGFDGVEVCLENRDLAPCDLTQARASEVCECLDVLGLARSVSYHKNYIFDDVFFAETKKAIKLTQAFGADVFVFAGTSKRDRPDEWQCTVERTLELVHIAEGEGVTLAQEFEPGFIVGCTADLHRLFDAIQSEQLKANLDLGHVFLCDPDPMAAIASLEGRIVHCHIENMATGVHCHLPPWEGDMDIPAYLRALSDIGYAGPLALDLYDGNYLELAGKSVPILKAMTERL